MVARGPLALAACLAMLVPAGCGSSTHAAQTVADSATKAVYDNDYSGLTSNFDSTVAPTVTRGEVGDLSDKMHKLGDYNGLTEMTADEGSHKYTYLAKFSNGAMMVQMRLDSDGKIAAYRVIPQQIPQ